jgi:hypothetical protein
VTASPRQRDLLHIDELCAIPLRYNSINESILSDIYICVESSKVKKRIGIDFNRSVLCWSRIIAGKFERSWSNCHY